MGTVIGWSSPDTCDTSCHEYLVERPPQNAAERSINARGEQADRGQQGPASTTLQRSTPAVRRASLWFEQRKKEVVLSSLSRLYSRTQRSGVTVTLGRETNIMGLDALRERLDVLDAQIVSLLSARAKVIREVADFKRRHGLPIYVPEREAALIQRLQTINPGPLPAAAVAHIYQTVLEEMRTFERASLVHESHAL